MRIRRRVSPERELVRHRIFDYGVLPVLAVIALFLVWKAFTA
jgi:hypothetical protein